MEAIHHFDNWCVKKNVDEIFLKISDRTHPERRSRSEEFVLSGRVHQRRSAAELSLDRLKIKNAISSGHISCISTNKCVP